MKPLIVVDQHIPFATELFSEIGHVRAVAGQKIDRSTVADADAIVVRSITKINEALLNGSNVRFVGTATAGTDHLDTDYLSSASISWASAPGANARSVVEYVLGAISVIARRAKADWRARTLGVVGCGHVGELLAQTAEGMGMSVLRNDPPRADMEEDGGFVPLHVLMSESDIVSVHVPLTHKGAHPTVHLLGETELSLMKPGSWLLQSSRGSTCDEAALMRAKADGRLDALVLDVYEKEPLPSLAVIDMADIATGHIAGYSIDAKRSGVEMIRSSLCASLGIERGKASSDAAFPLSMQSRGDSMMVTEPVHIDGLSMSPSDPSWLDKVLRQMIDIRQDDARFRHVMGVGGWPDAVSLSTEERAAAFHAYRASYPARRTFGAFHYPTESPNGELYRALGLKPAD